MESWAFSLLNIVLCSCKLQHLIFTSAANSRMHCSLFHYYFVLIFSVFRDFFLINCYHFPLRNLDERLKFYNHRSVVRRLFKSRGWLRRKWFGIRSVYGGGFWRSYLHQRKLPCKGFSLLQGCWRREGFRPQVSLWPVWGQRGYSKTCMSSMDVFFLLIILYFKSRPLSIILFYHRYCRSRKNSILHIPSFNLKSLSLKSLL